WVSGDVDRGMCRDFAVATARVPWADGCRGRPSGWLRTPASLDTLSIAHRGHQVARVLEEVHSGSVPRVLHDLVLGLRLLDGDDARPGETVAYDRAELLVEEDPGRCLGPLEIPPCGRHRQLPFDVHVLGEDLCAAVEQVLGTELVGAAERLSPEG